MLQQQSKEILVDGRKITIHAINLPRSLREAELRRFAIENPNEDKFIQVVRVVHVPVLLSYSSGDVFTENEILESRTSVIGYWWDEIMSLNPELDISNEEEGIEKKD